MTDWVIPAPLNQPVPRKVKMTWRGIGLLILFAGFSAAPITIIYSAIVTPGLLTELAIHGIDIPGTVIDVQPSHGRRGPYLVYRYTPKERAGTRHPTLQNVARISQLDYRRLDPGAVVQLVYDPLQPEHVALKSLVEADRLRKSPPTWGFLLLVTAFPGLPISIPTLYLVWRSFHERRLLRWGKTAMATIVHVQEEQGHGRVRRLLVTYVFRDDRGASWRDQTAFNLGAPDDPRPLDSRVGPPTVVYDPRDSTKNMLYPEATIMRLVG